MPPSKLARVFIVLLLTVVTFSSPTQSNVNWNSGGQATLIQPSVNWNSGGV